MRNLAQLNAILAALIVLAAATLVTLPAHAGPPACGPRSVIVERLAARFGETRRGIGMARGATVVEVFASADTGTWTVLATRADGTACLLASGRHWEERMDDLAHLADADA
jgi:hypothetical protein